MAVPSPRTQHSAGRECLIRSGSRKAHPTAEGTSLEAQSVGVHVRAGRAVNAETIPGGTHSPRRTRERQEVGADVTHEIRR